MLSLAHLCGACGHSGTISKRWPEAVAVLDQEVNRTLGAQLALVESKDHKDRDLQLPLVQMACCSATQETTGCTPALLMFGRELRTLTALAYGCAPDTPQIPAGPEYVTQLRESVDLAHQFARRQAEVAGDQHTKGTGPTSTQKI